jgi:hypothetical protein
MPVAMTLVLAVAVAQGVALRGLHALAVREAGGWSELAFLLPAYACTVGVPLSYYLLRTRLPAARVAAGVSLIGLALISTAAYVGWVNGPVGELRPATAGPVFLYLMLAVLGWFVALPFVRLGVRGRLTAEGYRALFDESWRVAITLGFAAIFVQLFWSLLLMCMALFDAIEVRWPRRIMLARSFYYPATCAAASFAIGLTDVRPEMFRGLRRLLLAVLRWLAVLASAIVLLFLATLLVGGVDPLWKTRFAAAALISVSLALITLYNTVYQTGTESDPLPTAFALPVRAALMVGPALAVLACWAVALRIGQYGMSEDRLQALVVIGIVAGFLGGYAIVACAGRRAPFEIRHVNVVMALAIIATLVLIHSPLVDLKRVAVASQLARLGGAAEPFDFRYLRFDLGRHGLAALERLVTSDDVRIARQARIVLAEANRNAGDLFGRRPAALDQARFLSRIEVHPAGRELPADLAEQLLAQHRATRRLWCVDQGPPCIALLVDLDDDGDEEVAVPLGLGSATVYSRRPEGWREVGSLTGRFARLDDLYAGLEQKAIRPLPPPRYHGVEIGEQRLVFTPCFPSDAQCADGLMPR